MRTYLEFRRRPFCPTLGINRDRLSCVRAVDWERYRPAGEACDRCGVFAATKAVMVTHSSACEGFASSAKLVVVESARMRGPAGKSWQSWDCR